MTSRDFQTLVQGMKSIPEDRRRELLSLADGLSDTERDTIAAHLAGIGADLQANTEKQSGLVARANLALDQIQQHDIDPLAPDA